MRNPDQIELERTKVAAPPQPAASGVKNILLHVQNDKSLDGRLETALSLARACGAHLTCLHITPIEAYVAFDSFGGVFVMKDVIKTLEEEEETLRASVEQELRNEDVSWSYEQVTGNIPAKLISYASLADLVVTGRDPHPADFAVPAVSLIGDFLYRARTPLFVPGNGSITGDLTGAAMIAWDGSYEAANAVRSSLGLLMLASNVHILNVVGGSKEDSFPGTRLLEYLSRHGIHAELSVIEAGVDVRDEDVVSATLVARAQAVGASYMVMGGYSHSRIGEYVFGGVTRNLLGECPVSLVIAH